MADPIGGTAGADPDRPGPGQFRRPMERSPARRRRARDRPRFTSTAIENVMHNGVVLFFTTPGVTFPTRIEIFSSGSDVLAGYDEFNDLN